MDSLLHILLMIGSALFMIIFFGLCIFIHELGHFLVAKMCGLHVIAFSIGFRKVWAKKIGGVEYRIGWLPFGGYVDLPQIDATGEAKDENGNPLPKAAPWKRMVTAFAGPFFNILFGLLVGCVIWVAGIPQDSPKMTFFTVQSVDEDSPEFQAGLRKGDVILKRNGQAFSETWNEFAQSIMLNVGDTVLDVKRGDQNLQVVYRPAINEKVSKTEKIPYPFFRPEIPVVVFPEAGSPAKKAGILPEDRIIRVNDREIFGMDELQLQVYYSLGRPITLDVKRNGQPDLLKITVIPEKYPDIKESDGSWAVGAMLGPGDGKHPRVEMAIPGMPAAAVFQFGDLITSVNGKDCVEPKDFIEVVKASKDQKIELTVLRNGESLQKTISPVYVLPHKIGLSFRILAHPDPIEQFVSVLDLTWKSLKSVTAGVKRRMGFNAGYTTIGPEHMSGPIGIGRYLYMSVYRGSIIMGLKLVVVLTYNLGLLNLLPIPVLDGGHIMLGFLEIVFRRPVSPKVLQPITYAFVFILISFMLFVSFYDVKKLIPLPDSWTKQPVKTETVEPASPAAEKVLPQDAATEAAADVQP